MGNDVYNGLLTVRCYKKYVIEVLKQDINIRDFKCGTKF